MIGIARLVVLCAIIVYAAPTVTDKKLMLILLDGLRWDFLDLYREYDLPGFRRIFDEGVVADHMVPVFPTVSYPNYFSIITGLYVENHGVVGNYMYDKRFNTTFEIFGTQKEQYYPYWYDEGIPLWVAAEKQNLRTSWYYWPGTEVTIRGMRPFHVTPYNQFVPTLDEHLDGAMKAAIDDFLHRNVSIVGIHVLKLDDDSHYKGFTSSSAHEAIVGIDLLLQNLLQDLDEKHLSDKVNLMIFSDHGHVDIPRNNIVNISGIIEDTDFQMRLAEGPVVYLWPKEERIDKVYRALKNFHPHMHVYMNNEIPERFHLKKHHRIPPILLVADLPWSIVASGSILFEPKVGYLSNHGYDNQNVEMRAMFAARGPVFKERYKAKPFANVCLYNIMCRILGIHPADNNGSWADVRDMLIEGVFEPGSEAGNIGSVPQRVGIKSRQSRAGEL